MVGVFLELRWLGSYEAKGKYEAREVDKGQTWKDTECYVNVFHFCFFSPWVWYRAIKDFKQGNGIIIFSILEKNFSRSIEKNELNKVCIGIKRDPLNVLKKFEQGEEILKTRKRQERIGEGMEGKGKNVKMARLKGSWLNIEAGEITLENREDNSGVHSNS